MNPKPVQFAQDLMFYVIEQHNYPMYSINEVVQAEYASSELSRCCFTVFTPEIGTVVSDYAAKDTSTAKNILKEVFKKSDTTKGNSATYDIINEHYLMSDTTEGNSSIIRNIVNEYFDKSGSGTSAAGVILTQVYQTSDTDKGYITTKTIRKDVFKKSDAAIGTSAAKNILKEEVIQKSDAACGSSDAKNILKEEVIQKSDAACGSSAAKKIRKEVIQESDAPMDTSTAKDILKEEVIKESDAASGISAAKKIRKEVIQESDAAMDTSIAGDILKEEVIHGSKDSLIYEAICALGKKTLGKKDEFDKFFEYCGHFENMIVCCCESGNTHLLPSLLIGMSVTLHEIYAWDSELQVNLDDYCEYARKYIKEKK